MHQAAKLVALKGITHNEIQAFSTYNAKSEKLLC